MLQKLPVSSFKWVEDLSKFDEGFIKSQNVKSKEGYFLEVGIQYPENLHKAPKVLPFLQERIKIVKVEKLVANLHDKNEYVIHVWNLEQTLNHGLVSKKVHWILKFIQKIWVKPYIDMNTELRKKTNFFSENLLAIEVKSTNTYE